MLFHFIITTELSSTFRIFNFNHIRTSIWHKHKDLKTSNAWEFQNFADKRITLTPAAWLGPPNNIPAGGSQWDCYENKAIKYLSNSVPTTIINGAALKSSNIVVKIPVFIIHGYKESFELG